MSSLSNKQHHLSPLLPYSTGSTPNPANASSSSSSANPPPSSSSRRRSNSFSRSRPSATRGGPLTFDRNQLLQRLELGSLARSVKTKPLHWVWILVGCCSLWGNLSHWWNGPTIVQVQTRFRPQSIFNTLPPPSVGLGLGLGAGGKVAIEHLIMVPGHAIWTGCDASRATSDVDWILEEMQRGGDVRTYLKHITKGAELAVLDPSSLLIFSGGMTRPHTTLSEAMSYYRLARAGNLYAKFRTEQDKERLRREGREEGEFERVTTEDFALDSLENVLFSIARFKEFTGDYPTKVTVVGFNMKRRRYQEVHRASIRFPTTKFQYVGIDNDHDTEADYTGERIGGLQPWVADMYGCHSPLLDKRIKRNPYRRVHGYHISAPEMHDLFEYCPADNEPFPGVLPWAEALPTESRGAEKKGKL